LFEEYARVAQLAERSIRNAKVGSSILPAGFSFSDGRFKAAFFISCAFSPAAAPVVVLAFYAIMRAVFADHLTDQLNAELLLNESDRSFFRRLR
jgi:hypothetical protein